MAIYQATLTNEVTGEYTVIKARDPYTFQSRIDKKKAQWSQQNYKILSKQKAQEKTRDALERIELFKSILKDTLNVDDKIDWEVLKSQHKFTKPNWKDYESQVSVYGGLEKLPFITSLFSSIRSKKEEQIKEQQQRYEFDLAQYNKGIEKWIKKYDRKKDRYEANDLKGVQSYFNLVLERSNYPANFNLLYDIDYRIEEKLIIIDVLVPSYDEFPNIVEYRYNQSKDEMTEVYMKSKDFEQFFNNVIYQIMLRTIHEMIEADYANHIELVVVNTKIEKVNKKIGTHEEPYIASLQVSKEEFESINLENIDPKECFRHMKGVSAGSLIELSAVKPIMRINKEDNRIIKADAVVDNFDETTNLATIEWQDFEVLVRDLIQKEFASEGCTVEVTRASRDAGVDAIAFDEDPIRGGKFVIQAKRYNNLVPLTAVRDLYGTVISEGATKGILITTSHFGKDSLEFIKNKPLMLINGNEMLYMFNKHGYEFKIELTKKKKRESKSLY